MFGLTKESMELLIDEIIDAVEFNSDDRNAQFEAVKTILTENGIDEIR